MRIHEPGKLTRNPNFAKLQDVERDTCKWEQSQRPLYLRQLQRSQQPADSSESVVRMTFPSQLVHDLNVLRRLAAASGTTGNGAATEAAGAVGSGPTPGSGGSVGSSQQVRCFRFCFIVIVFRRRGCAQQKGFTAAQNGLMFGL
jgi:hypothetical protein